MYLAYATFGDFSDRIIGFFLANCKDHPTVPNRVFANGIVG